MSIFHKIISTLQKDSNVGIYNLEEHVPDDIRFEMHYNF